jgi:hypothetical protein
VAHLVGQHPAEPGDVALVAQEAVHAHVVGGERGGQRRRREVERLGPEAVERRAGERVGGHAPHTGATLLAGLGEQQRGPLGEHEARLTVARLRGLFVVDQQPPALHQVHDEVDGPEVEQ